MPVSRTALDVYPPRKSVVHGHPGPVHLTSVGNRAETCGLQKGSPTILRQGGWRLPEDPEVEGIVLGARVGDAGDHPWKAIRPRTHGIKRNRGIGKHVEKSRRLLKKYSGPR